MDRNSNAYTFLFAIIMVIVLGASLAFIAESTKEARKRNVELEKKQNILSAIGVNVDRDQAEIDFDTYIKQQLTVKSDGSIDANVNAFTVELKKEVKKTTEDQSLPLYIAEKDGKTYYIVPLYGAGLWDAIWGYIGLDTDENTIIGAVFDHKGETAGLGAEINQSWYEDQYIGDKIMDENGNFVSVKAIKGGTPLSNLHGVDAISGGTITSDGVSDMVEERLARYIPYFKNN
ncbi:MAG: NADH:ubiquinone reductase (Na(+)-transporting) subunit C [Flavobacteriaceae bacterium]|nr:MAG: NADH:ubiquinone reductase (Na(+)-transporting) subunit C [Flavobacteriaceae bacterium]